jgi:sialate O-acetylesterase
MKIISTILFVLFCNLLVAQVSLPKFFGDNMVLQRNNKIPIWGWAKANEKISVQFHNQTRSTDADNKGKWMVNLDAETAGGPYDLIVTGSNSIKVTNVLVGDVWLCTGQSNMEWTVGQSNNAQNEIANSNYPLIRHIKIKHAVNTKADIDLKDTASWNICNSNTVADFTGVGYFFAKNIFENTKIPIGLINTCWGGTNIETWISREAFENSNEFASMIAGMPILNFDSLSNLRSTIVAKRIGLLQKDKLPIMDVSPFNQVDYDDAAWPTMNVPQQWEEQSLGEIDGVVWFRKTITLSAEDANATAVIELSKIDDDDITYINGIKVGSTNKWDEQRKYNVPAGVLRAGKNVIAVRIVDNTGGGGFYGNKDDVKLTVNKNAIPLSGSWKFQVEKVFDATIGPNSFPSICYNSMIAPLIPFSFKGVFWYQGESNAGRAYQYKKALPLLIADWRKKFNNKNAPFYIAQLASYVTSGNSNEGCGWAELREAQAQTLSVPNTGLVVTTDLVTEPNDIHPKNKQDVGKRFAAIALNNLYNRKMICSGPTYKSMIKKGNQIILSFNNIGSRLSTTNKNGEVRGFEIAGADSIFYAAKAMIQGNTVVLSSDKVPNPLVANFGWVGDATACNLYNKEGFPAVPFRTADWKTVTKKEKYSIEKLR